MTDKNKLLELIADDLAVALYETHDLPEQDYKDARERNWWLLVKNKPEKWEAYRNCARGLLARLLKHYAYQIDPNHGEFL